MQRGSYAATDSGIDRYTSRMCETSVAAWRDDRYLTNVFSEHRNLPKAADIGTL